MRLFFCQKCKASGKLSDLPISVLDRFHSEVRNFIYGEPEITGQSGKKLSLPKEFIFPITKEHGIPFRYLEKRRVTLTEQLEYGIGFCSEGFYHDRIILPIYDGDQLVYFIGRSYTTIEPKYLNSPISRKEIIFRTYNGVKDEVVLVEGIFDALRVGKWFPAIATLGKEITSGQILKIIKVARSIIVCFDPDADSYSWEASTKLSYHIPTRTVDLVNRGSKDPGSSSKSEIVKLITGRTK